MVGIGDTDVASLLLASIQEKKSEVEDCNTLTSQVLCK